MGAAESNPIRNMDKRTARREYRDSFMRAIAKYRNAIKETSPAMEANIKTASSSKNEDLYVCIRKRPLFQHEIQEGEFDVITCVSDTILAVHDARMHIDMKRQFMNHNEFYYDYVFSDTAKNEDVYLKCASRLVKLSTRGGYATCLVYGQTGSGKTYTMSYIYERSCHDIFHQLRGFPQATVSVSFVEIAGDNCFDLLNAFTPAQLLTGHDEGVYPYPVVEPTLNSSEELLAMIRHGCAVRSTAATGVNDTSSRSHAILRIYIQLPLGTGTSSGTESPESVKEGVLTLVDLAGSEYGIDSMYHSAERRKEGAAINASLMALKECIRSRANGEVNNSVFRNSKLTLALKSSFTFKTAKTAIIATVSPASKDTEHSLSTLRHACIMHGQSNDNGETRFLTGGAVHTVECGEVNVTEVARLNIAAKKASAEKSFSGAGVVPPPKTSNGNYMDNSTAPEWTERDREKARRVAERRAVGKLSAAHLELLQAARARLRSEPRQSWRLQRLVAPYNAEDTIGEISPCSSRSGSDAPIPAPTSSSLGPRQSSSVPRLPKRSKSQSVSAMLRVESVSEALTADVDAEAVAMPVEPKNGVRLGSKPIPVTSSPLRSVPSQIRGGESESRNVGGANGSNNQPSSKVNQSMLGKKLRDPLEPSAGLTEQSNEKYDSESNSKNLTVDEPLKMDSIPSSDIKTNTEQSSKSSRHRSFRSISDASKGMQSVRSSAKVGIILNEMPTNAAEKSLSSASGIPKAISPRSSPRGAAVTPFNSPPALAMMPAASESASAGSAAPAVAPIDQSKWGKLSDLMRQSGFSDEEINVCLSSAPLAMAMNLAPPTTAYPATGIGGGINESKKVLVSPRARGARLERHVSAKDMSAMTRGIAIATKESTSAVAAGDGKDPGNTNISQVTGAESTLIAVSGKKNPGKPIATRQNGKGNVTDRESQLTKRNDKEIDLDKAIAEATAANFDPEVISTNGPVMHSPPVRSLSSGSMAGAVVGLGTGATLEALGSPSKVSNRMRRGSALSTGMNGAAARATGIRRRASQNPGGMNTAANEAVVGHEEMKDGMMKMEEGFVSSPPPATAPSSQVAPEETTQPKQKRKKGLSASSSKATVSAMPTQLSSLPAAAAAAPSKGLSSGINEMDELTQLEMELKSETITEAARYGLQKRLAKLQAVHLREKRKGERLQREEEARMNRASLLQQAAEAAISAGLCTSVDSQQNPEGAAPPPTRQGNSRGFGQPFEVFDRDSYRHSVSPPFQSLENQSSQRSVRHRHRNLVSNPSPSGGRLSGVGDERRQSEGEEDVYSDPMMAAPPFPVKRMLSPASARVTAINGPFDNMTENNSSPRYGASHNQSYVTPRQYQFPGNQVPPQISHQSFDGYQHHSSNARRLSAPYQLHDTLDDVTAKTALVSVHDERGYSVSVAGSSRYAGVER